MASSNIITFFDLQLNSLAGGLSWTGTTGTRKRSMLEAALRTTGSIGGGVSCPGGTRMHALATAPYMAAGDSVVGERQPGNINVSFNKPYIDTHDPCPAGLYHAPPKPRLKMSSETEGGTTKS